jgi:ELWxxDGT repeat protein
VTDGNAAGTHLLKDVPGGAVHHQDGSTGPVVLEAGKALFTFSDGAGVQLWTADGTEAGTSAVTRSTWGTKYLRPHGLVALGDGRALYGVGEYSKTELWVTDGTAAGTTPVTTAPPSPIAAGQATSSLSATPRRGTSCG